MEIKCGGKSGGCSGQDKVEELYSLPFWDPDERPRRRRRRGMSRPYFKNLTNEENPRGRTKRQNRNGGLNYRDRSQRLKRLSTQQNEECDNCGIDN